MASLNINFMVETAETFQEPILPLKGVFWNMASIFTTLETFQLERFPSKLDAPSNKCHISETLETFHVDISPLNALANRNIPLMVTALDTSHSDKS